MKASCKLVNRIKGTNITADTVAGLGRIKKIWGKTTETGTGEKSPTNPYTLKCVGDNINLFNGIFRQGNNEGTATESRLYSTQILYLEKGMEYTFSTNLNLSVYNYGVQLLSVAPPTVSGNRFFDSLWRTESSYVFTPSKSGFFGICIRKQNETNLTVNDISNVKFELKSKYGTIEIISKNGEQQSSNMVYIDKPLCSIGNVRDELDYTKGKIIRRCAEIILNGTENWQMAESVSGISRFNCTYSSLKNGSNFVCDKFKTIKQSLNLNEESIVQRDLSNDATINIRIKDTRLSNISVQGFKTWLQSNPITVIYELATPTEEDIECSDKIVQYSNTTTVYNVDGAEIEVSLTNNKAISEVNENINELEKKQETIKTKIWAMNANTQKTIVNIPGLKKIINVYCMDESVTTYPNREIIAFKQDGENVTVVQKGTIQYTNYFTIVYV